MPGVITDLSSQQTPSDTLKAWLANCKLVPSTNKDWHATDLETFREILGLMGREARRRFQYIVDNMEAGGCLTKAAWGTMTVGASWTPGKSIAVVSRVKGLPLLMQLGPDGILFKPKPPGPEGWSNVLTFNTVQALGVLMEQRGNNPTSAQSYHLYDVVGGLEVHVIEHR